MDSYNREVNEFITRILYENHDRIISDWLQMAIEKIGSGTLDLLDRDYLTGEADEVLSCLRQVVETGVVKCQDSPNYSAMSALLHRLSAYQAKREVAPDQTAAFVFCIKDAVFDLISQNEEVRPAVQRDSLSLINRLVDQVALVTVNAYTNAREKTIIEQSQAILELSTPIIKLWEDILLLPLVGMVDTLRANQIIEGLLQAIYNHEVQVTILDVTGVPIIDTRVAQHLIQTVTAARMLGADVILTGISPDMAQTLVKLDIDLGIVITKGTLAAGVAEAFRLLGKEIASSFD